MDVFVQYGWLFLQGILNYIVPLLAIQVAGLLVVWITKVINDVKAKLTADQLVILQTAVDIGIKAAEQLKIKDALIDKKTEAIKIAQQYLTDHKVQVNIVTLDAMVEAAVYQAFNANK